MGVTVFLESSIMQKGKPATAGSKMLAGFIAPFNATVIERLEVAGVKIAGRVELSEFGTGGLFDEETLTDAVNNADIILCNDYTGAISRAAAANGLYYIHPTYGTVSRYGLIPAVSSMDQIGILCKNPEEGFDILKIIQGYDEKDGVMSSLFSPLTGELKNTSPLDNSPLDNKTEEPSPCPALEQVMRILCCGELANNISRYDGVKFGYRAKEYNGLNELYTKSRTEAFGEGVKLAAIIGAMVLYQEDGERIYDKAMKVRRMIRDSFEFDKYDVIKSCNPAISRLCGFPSLTTPQCTYISGAGCEDILKAIRKDNGVE